MSVQAMVWALEHSASQHSERLVLISLANHSGEENISYPSIPTIAKEANLGESTVRAALDRLKVLGEIVEVGVSRLRTRTFQLTFDTAGSAGVQDLRPPQDLAAIPAGSGAIPADTGPKPSLTVNEPSQGVRAVFDAWVTSTKRDPRRTQLNPARRRLIDNAVKQFGLDDCLAAVRNIGRDPWASGANDRGRPFNDLKHALGSAEQLERWRDWTPEGRHLRPVGTPASPSSADLVAAFDRRRGGSAA